MSQQADRAMRTARRGERDDAGVTLIEVMVAIFALTLVSIAAATFFVSAVRTTAEQSDKQNATALATQALEAVQSVPVSQVLKGRRQADVLALTNSLGTLVSQDIVDTDSVTPADPLDDNFDSAATATASPVIPLTRAQTLEGTTYTVKTAINKCWLSRANKVCTRAKPPTDGILVLRSTVNLTWGKSGCGSRCSYSVSALLDRQDDPFFGKATSVPIIVTAGPDIGTAGVPTGITLTGVDIFNGAVLKTVAPGGGTFTVLEPSADGKSWTTKWTPGDVPGLHTLELKNLDTGRAEYSSLTVLPAANADCVAFNYFSGPTDLAVQANDRPSNGGVLTIVTQPTQGIASIVGNKIRWTPIKHSGYFGDFYFTAPGTYEIRYTLAVNEQVSTVAVVTLNVSNGGCS